MSKLNKAIAAEIFQIDGNININYIFFSATNIYGIKINNFNIKLVIQ